MKYLLNIILLTSLAILQDSKGGIPYNIKSNISNQNSISMPSIDINALLEEDQNTPKGRPFRYGNKFNVNLNLSNSGNWTSLENGDLLWTLAIESKGAFAIALEYSQFYLPEGSSFYVYNPQQSSIHGAYTSENNQDDGLFSTPLVEGDIIYLEFYLPSNNSEESFIDINYVIHDYRDILNFSQSRESRDCGDNVVCNSASAYEDQINATSWLDMGGYMCSGAMINNTNFDLTPYYWTAWHCTVNENPSTFRFYFNYETNSCSGSWASNGTYEYGGNLLLDSNGIDPDYALILITDSSISDGIFYSGWDKSSSSPSISCGVHHPGGEPKKINFDNDNAYNSGPVNWGDPDYDGDDDTSPSGSHWRITWDEGGTEGGSSGSPAFNTNGLLIGQLTGGDGSCSNGSGQDYYGKFSRSFSDVSQWLDPSNTGASYIEGIYEAMADTDGDGIDDNADSNNTDPYQCSDIDQDTCDDCSSGTFNASDDGWDYDNDGLCDDGDIDDDNDGAIDTQDTNDNNSYECSDNDFDSCDDCSSGMYDPLNDGCILIQGDLNLDNIINIIDVVMLVNIILGSLDPSDAQLITADMNEDSAINISDIIILLNIILN